MNLDPVPATPISPDLAQKIAHLDIPRTQVVPMYEFLTGMCNKLNCRFTFDDETHAPAYIMSEFFFLPALAWSAQQCGQRVFGTDLGCRLVRHADSLFGVRAEVPPVTGHVADILRALVFMQAARDVFSVRQNSVIEMAGIYEGFSAAFTELIGSAAPEQTEDKGGEIPWPPVQRHH